MAFSRRTFVKLLTSATAGGVSSLSFLKKGRASSLDNHSLVTIPQDAFSATAIAGQTYPLHGYKLFIIDFQFSDLDPDTMRNADAEKYADAMVEMGVESLVVYAITNTGFALYKSQFAPKFKNLTDDFLGDYLAACRKRKIKTVLYHSLGWQRILDVEHPDWAVLDAQSRPVQSDTSPYGFMGPVNFLCLNSPFREHAVKQVKEIADRYTFDSWFEDILFFDRSQVCYNPGCLAKWKARTGEDLPRPLPASLYPQYLDFVIETYRSAYQEIKDQLRASGHNVPVTHNFGLDFAVDDYVIMESNPRGFDFYETTMRTKLYRAHAHGRELQMVPHLNNDYLDYVNAPLPKLTWQTAVAVSHNAAVMWGQQANVDGTLDPSTIRIAKRAFQVADRLVPKVKGTVPYAEIAVLYSERDQLLTHPNDYADFYGANKLLTDLHWPFDVITDDHLSMDELSRFRMLIVPNVQYISAEHRHLVLEWLEKGGSLFFCGHCATFDRAGKLHPEANFGLVKIKETHAPRGYVTTVFPIDDDRLKASDIATVDASTSQRVLGRLVQLSATRREGFPLGDVAYPRRQTDLPVMITQMKGKGHFTYVGYGFFKEYLKQDLPVIQQTFVGLVSEFYQPAVWVEAPSVVEAIYSQTKAELRVALVNAMTGRPSGGGDQFTVPEARGYINITEVIPISGLRIILRERAVRRASNLAGEDLPMSTRGDQTVVTVPRLEQYDLITVELK
jgi:hypothetical protein